MKNYNFLFADDFDILSKAMKGDLYRRNVVIVFCLVIAGLLDAVLLTREGLWVDEVFSLAGATGHSLEHPASEANPSFGDFQEPPQPVDPSYFRRYSEHEDPPASLSRVLRGVLISDTNPPLYYMLLHYWTRWLGTTDIALRLFSLFFALACFPVLWSLGRQLGGRRTAAFSCLFFSLSPVALQYSVEGRMYSLVWFLVLAMVWLILNLRKNGFHKINGPLLVLTGTSGLLTHYYFIFVFLAFAFWVLFDPGHLSRTKWLLLFLCMVILITPWYAYVPESLGRWRVTKDWLRHPVPLGGNSDRSLFSLVAFTLSFCVVAGPNCHRCFRSFSCCIRDLSCESPKNTFAKKISYRCNSVAPGNFAWRTAMAMDLAAGGVSWPVSPGSDFSYESGLGVPLCVKRFACGTVVDWILDCPVEAGFAEAVSCTVNCRLHHGNLGDVVRPSARSEQLSRVGCSNFFKCSTWRFDYRAFDSFRCYLPLPILDEIHSCYLLGRSA